MMNGIHEANQRYWERLAQDWRELRDRDLLWQVIPQQPELAFDGEALGMIRQFAGDLQGKQACVVGSGDNYVAFALAGMGASVTSTDISTQQLEIAQQRAASLGLDITFHQADAANLNGLPDGAYDLVCSSNGFFVWISDPESVFRSIFRVLKPGGFYIFYDVHPFQRPWKDQAAPLEMVKPYVETGPYEHAEAGQVSFEFHWRLSDLLNPLVESGLVIRQLAETQAKARYWQDFSYEPGSYERLLDWRDNPRAGLPAWLTVAAQKLE
jgi:SAM-dependent methyltransferase